MPEMDGCEAAAAIRKLEGERRMEREERAQRAERAEREERETLEEAEIGRAEREGECVREAVPAPMAQKQQQRRVPEMDRVLIFALTADIGAGTRERCARVGMDGYMTKPVEEEQLCRVMLGPLRVPCVESEHFVARLNVGDSANVANEAILEAPQSSAEQVKEASPAVSPASPGVEPLEPLGNGNVPFDLARISPHLSDSSLPIGDSFPGSGGSAPVFSSGMLPWLRNPSELDLNLPSSPPGDSAATPALVPSSAAFPSSFQVLNSSFWESSANCGANGGAASPPVSENSSESSLVACGSESSSTDMDDEEDNNEDEDGGSDGEADSGIKPLCLKKKVSAMTSLPSQ
ncbi:unnamed protein product [Closterium sp. Yama58-4]|nr:unnamed protein product [Closterium sp. Yama58-4]